MDKFKVTFPGNKKVDVAFNGFLINTDQSRENNGDETAPEPFALFLSAVASCAGIYAKSFCDLRKIDTRNMVLELEPSFREGQKLMEKITVTLNVNQEFPEKYIKAIIKAMEGCAVKNQLHPDIQMNTAVAYLAS